MAKYLVTYRECYDRTYEVEANSKEEAEENIRDDIFEGRREPPDNCYDSSFCTEEIKDTKCFSFLGFMDRTKSIIQFLSKRLFS